MEKPKVLTLTVEIKDMNTPQNWSFTQDVSGIEQVAIWTIVKSLAERNLNALLDGNNKQN